MLQFHVLSFEGPDQYAYAGGIASRITGLSQALADMGYETHLWFVGDPKAPGHEQRGNLVLHRWCQWISQHHPAGVYDGEDGKKADYAASVPPFLMKKVLLPHLRQGGQAVVLAEEWHTADTVQHLHCLLERVGLRGLVNILWNANNTFGFHKIDWNRLERASVITTVSRYMKQILRGVGVESLVIPNGLSADVFEPADDEAVHAFRKLFPGRAVITKVARFDPDKRWLQAIDIVGELKRDGHRPLLIARGGIEAHGAEVYSAASRFGLRLIERVCPEPGVDGMLKALGDIGDADIVSLKSHLNWQSRSVLFGATDVVLANSGHEPFGLVGLETMAAGGVACTGFSGEDYVVPGRNALVLQTADPREFIGLFNRLRTHPDEDRTIRENGQVTAAQFAWPEIIQRDFLPRIEMLQAQHDAV